MTTTAQEDKPDKKSFPEKIKGLPRFARRLMRNSADFKSYSRNKSCVCGMSDKYIHAHKKGHKRWKQCSRCGHIAEKWNV